jgi:hypothetical protein
MKTPYLLNSEHSCLAVPYDSREATSMGGQTRPDVSSEALYQEDSPHERRASPPNIGNRTGEDLQDAPHPDEALQVLLVKRPLLARQPGSEDYDQPSAKLPGHRPRPDQQRDPAQPQCRHLQVLRLAVQTG